MIEGILFDIDGVIVDSEPFLAEACRIFFEKRGCKVTPEDFLPYVGAGENKYIGCVAEKYGVPIEIESAKTEVYRIFDEVAGGSTSLGKMPPMPGIVRFFNMASKAGLKMALASSADRMKVEINLRSAGFRPEDFDCLVSGSQLQRKKPFGDIYTYAALKIGLAPDQCIVVEDALNGVMASRAAGSKSIAVLGSFSEEELRSHGADIVLDNMLSFPDFGSKEEFSRCFEKIQSDQMMAQYPESLQFIMKSHEAGVLSDSYSVFGGNAVKLADGQTVTPLCAAAVSLASADGKKARIDAVAMKSLDRLSLMMIQGLCSPDARVFVTEPQLSLSRLGWVI